MTLRKRFEERKWKQSKSIHEYVHDKLILGNKITAPEEIVEYIVEEIPDVHLRDHARMQSFGSRNTLLQTSLSDKPSSGSIKQGKRNFNQQTMESHQKTTGNQHGSDQKKPSRRCFNCGEHSHMGAESKCPSKSEGIKCFKCVECAERGHIASRCPNKNKTAGNEVAKSDCAKSQTVNQIKRLS